MNKIAKILSVVLSASIALTVAVVTLVSALAADAPVYSLNKVSETDTEIVISINLDSGKMENAEFKLATSNKIASCTKIAKGDVLKSDDYSVMFASNPESLNTDKPVIALASTPEIAEKCVCATITLKKASAAKISAEDITLVENSANAKVVNNIPVIQVVTTTQKPAETTTKAPETTTKVPETTTEAEVETTTEAEVETTTEAEVETTTAVVVVDDETTTEATVGTTAVIEDGTTEEAVVVNPDTGDSATASAAIVALLAVSGAAVVALRKKEN